MARKGSSLAAAASASVAAGPETMCEPGQFHGLAVIGDQDVFRLEIGDRMTLLIANDDVERNFFRGGDDFEAGIGRGWRRSLAQTSGRKAGKHRARGV